MDDFFTKKYCDRCGKILKVRTMSRFNEDCICEECSKKEKEHSLYKKAVKEEIEEVKKGNYNFKGIGKPADL